MENLTINKAALASILEEIYRLRGKKYATRLADAIFAVAADSHDTVVKALLGIDPL